MAGNRIEIQVVGDTKDLERALSRAGKTTESSFRKMGRAAGLAGAAIFAGLAVVGKRGFDELAESQKVMAQTRAVLKSTGKVAKVSADDVTKLAESLSDLSGVDDEVIASGENLLLTFTNIRNETGKNNDIFDQATRAALDMSVALGTDLSNASILVGKALNDPKRGLTALRRVGVQFTKQQENQIKKMVKAGDTIGAQKVILEELRKEFEGSAKAAGDTLPGKLEKLRNKFDEVAGSLVEKLIPHLETVLDKLATFAEWAEKNPNKIRNIAIAVGVLAGALAFAAAMQTLLNLAVLANPFVAAVAAIVAIGIALVIAYKKSEKFRAVVDAVISFVREHWFKLLFAFGLLPAIIVKIIQNWGTLKGKAQAVFSFIRGIVQSVRDAFQRVIDKVRAVISKVKDIGDGPVLAAIRKLLGPLASVLSAVQSIISAVQSLIGWIRAIPDIGTQVPGGRAPIGPGSRPPRSNPNRAQGSSTNSTSSRGRYTILADQEFVDHLRATDQNYRRTNGGRGIFAT